MFAVFIFIPVKPLPSMTKSRPVTRWGNNNNNKSSEYYQRSREGNVQECEEQEAMKARLFKIMNWESESKILFNIGTERGEQQKAEKRRMKIVLLNEDSIVKCCFDTIV